MDSTAGFIACFVCLRTPKCPRDKHEGSEVNDLVRQAMTKAIVVGLFEFYSGAISAAASTGVS